MVISRLPLITLSLLFILTGSAVTAGERSLLRNGELAQWADDAPRDWSVVIGASQGSGKKSTLSRVPGGGVSLAGDASVVEWKFVSQSLTVEPGSFYQVTFEARATDIRRDGRQNMNCYAGILTRNPRGGLGSSSLRTILNEDWAPGAATLQIPVGVTQAEVAVFLSNSGRLEARRFALRKVNASQSLAVLGREFSRYYSFFDLKKTNWKRLISNNKQRLQKTTDAVAFKDLLKTTLKPLRDLHVWVQMPGGPLEPTYQDQPAINFDYQTVLGKLQDVQQISKIGAVGRTREGYGYLVLASLTGSNRDFQAVEEKLVSLFDAPGLIIDIRANGGGNEHHAQRLAGYFTEKPLLYARNLERSGPKPKDLMEVGTRTLQPNGKRHYSKPIVCLTGRKCMSSGEGFAMMMKALPSCTILGQPTRGASGNPHPITLPIGVIVHYSTWVSQLPDGTPIEGRGVPVDMEVKHARTGDSTYDAAIRELTRRVKADE